jgi:hypothetical protein
MYFSPQFFSQNPINQAETKEQISPIPSHGIQPALGPGGDTFEETKGLLRRHIGCDPLTSWVGLMSVVFHESPT